MKAPGFPWFRRRARLPAPGRSWRRKRLRLIPWRRPMTGNPVPRTPRRAIGATGPHQRDPMVQRARIAGDPLIPVRRCPAGERPTADPQVQPARAPQVPAGGAQPPDIDLPPIEGAPEVQVPKLPPNPEDLPPNLQPLPAPDGSVAVPELPRTGPGRGRDGQRGRRQDRPAASRRADHRRLSDDQPLHPQRATASDRATPDHTRRRNTYICRGGINIVTAYRQVRARSTSRRTRP